MKKDWEKFYKENKAPKTPSSFCKFIIGKKLDGYRILDIGCGNGRDTKALNRKVFAVGIDPALPAELQEHNKMIKASCKGSKLIDWADIIYSRFFLHAIPYTETEEIIKRTRKYFVAEARAEGDTPVVYPSHERHYIDGEWLLQTLIKNSFEILHYEKSRGLAPYKNEDPLVIRVIAKKI